MHYSLVIIFPQQINFARDSVTGLTWQHNRTNFQTHKVLNSGNFLHQMCTIKTLECYRLASLEVSGGDLIHLFIGTEETELVGHVCSTL